MVSAWFISWILSCVGESYLLEALEPMSCNLEKATVLSVRYMQNAKQVLGLSSSDVSSVVPQSDKRTFDIQV